MFNLSTQEVVLSIENSPVENHNGLIYQKYPNFFGKIFDLHFDEKENFVKLENQHELNRKKLSMDDDNMKKLTVFFMNSKITSQGNIFFTFPFRKNYGYSLLNNEYSQHGVEEIETDGTTSIYVRYQ